jgi:hypothetical protein
MELGLIIVSIAVLQDQGPLVLKVEAQLLTEVPGRPASRARVHVRGVAGEGSELLSAIITPV